MGGNGLGAGLAGLPTIARLARSLGQSRMLQQCVHVNGRQGGRSDAQVLPNLVYALATGGEHLADPRRRFGPSHTDRNRLGDGRRREIPEMARIQQEFGSIYAAFPTFRSPLGTPVRGVWFEADRRHRG